MNKIKLDSSVAVSDPCYDIAELIIGNLLPGNYISFALGVKCGDWGDRVSTLACVHESFAEKKLKWHERGAIGVDSGQAGIFDPKTYKNDESVANKEAYDFGENYHPQDEGDRWYRVWCNMTIGDPGWGTYDKGVVSSSGIGDGCYDVYVAKSEGKIVGIHIDFGLLEKANFHFYI